MAYIPNALPKLWSTIATVYSATSAYAIDDYCQYDGAMYKCTTAIAAPGETWNPAHWTEVTVASQLGGSGSISWAPVANDYSSTATYDEGDFAIQEGKLYKAKQNIATPEAFTPAHWDQTSATDEIVNLDFSYIAPDFVATTTYASGDYVMYDGKVYRANKAHTGAWAAADFNEITVAPNAEALHDNIADEMIAPAWEKSATKSYEKDEFVSKKDDATGNTYLYYAKEDIAANQDWDASKWQRTDVASNLSRDSFALQADIANEWTATPATPYAKGDIVYHDDKLYVATDIPGAEVPSASATKWATTTISDNLGDNLKHVANDYDKTATYELGSYVIYDGKLYKEINPDGTTGDFAAADWSETNVADNLIDFHPEITRLINKLCTALGLSVTITGSSPADYDFEFEFNV